MAAATLGMPAGRPASSLAVSTLALLQEPDAALQVHALKKLAATIDEIWADAADVLPAVEALAEDNDFPARELAAYVAAKVSAPPSGCAAGAHAAPVC